MNLKQHWYLDRSDRHFFLFFQLWW